jgi:2-polyprenyl-3-methyl-5-hydroxy-6-metoxy-1,4-benzoquinol methylase
MERKIEEIFSQVEKESKFLAGPSGDIQNWNRDYFKNHRKRYQNDLRMVSKYFTSGEILELGSAPFHFTSLLVHLNMPVTAVDIDPDRFKELTGKWDINVVKCNIETEDLPFEEHSFHLVLFNEIFEHMRIDPIETLVRIRRILNPDGFLILSTPNLYSITSYVNFLLGKGFDDPYEQFEKIKKFGHMGHVREYSVAQVKKFLEKTGFKIVETSLQSHRPLKGLWAPFNLVRRIFPQLHAYQTHVCRID